MADIEATPNPYMLAWARQTSRLSLPEVLERCATSAQALASWETGEARPTVKQLRTLATVYKRPFALFFLSEVPADFTVPHDFRRPMDAPESLSPALALELRAAHARREEAIALAEAIGEEIPPFTARVSRADSIMDAAAALREALGVSPSEQFEWGDQHGYEALRQWITAVEALGVLVFQPEHIPEQEARGFSIGARPYPVIALNGGDYPRGRVFTLMHELVHVALHEGGVCNLKESKSAGRFNAQTERFCNRVAAEVLVPTAEIRRHDLVRTAAPDGEWSDAGIEMIARDFHVSREVILRRLVEIGAASHKLYRSKRADFLAAYRRNRKKQSGKGGPPPARMAVRRVGRPFAHLVLDAYARDVVQTSQLPDYFGVRLRHMPRVHMELAIRAGTEEERGR